MRSFRQRHGQLAGPSEGVEQDRRGGAAPDQSGNRRAVGTTDPDANRHATVEADRPGIAITVAGAGLEGDTVSDSVVRRRRSHQYVADLPRRDAVHQPQRLRRLVAGLPDFLQRHRAAETRKAAVELHEVLQSDADAAEPHRQPRHFTLGQRQVTASLPQPRRHAAGADAVEQRHGRHVQRHL